ncbi:MAG: hypothetical protein FJZ08_01975, partial [Candidatus Omnitrophica bacterium]|nr:hypothetical protein [Candidatus Omnitrophota bacterium]
MERKDRYLLAEFLLTFLLLYLLTFLFGEVFLNYRIYLAAGLATGFIVSWLLRSKEYPLAKGAVNIAVTGLFLWVIYSLWRSSFFYSDVITIFIKGGILLGIVLSFDSSCPSSLAYLQALSLPLLMCFPAFVKQYNNSHIILVLAYLLFWAAILKVKF